MQEKIITTILDGYLHHDFILNITCLLYTSDAADDLLCVDLGGRRIIKKKNHTHNTIILTHSLLPYHH